MAEREKVLKGLECCSQDPVNCPMDCPYINLLFCQKALADEALQVMKEQPEQKHGYWKPDIHGEE